MFETILFEEFKNFLLFVLSLNLNINPSAKIYINNWRQKIPDKPTKAYKDPAQRGPINRVALLERVSIAREELKRFFLIFSANTRLLTARSTTQVIPFINARVNAK